MSQHFLLSSRAKTLTLASVARMSDEEAEDAFRKIRWASNNGNPFCPKCGCTIVYDCRRANGTARWRCKACRHSFSITSGTLFHSRKMHPQPLGRNLAGRRLDPNRHGDGLPDHAPAGLRPATER